MNLYFTYTLLMSEFIAVFLRRVEGKLKILLRRFAEVMVRQRNVGRGVARYVDVSRFGAAEESDIRDHLNFLSFMVYLQRPRVLLELGTRGGESTRVFEDYCKSFSLTGRSIDLETAPKWLQDKGHWKHYAGDDCELGDLLARTQKWPDGIAFQPIDFLFVDTSHEYEHTCRELETFFPLVNSGGFLVFHDTNLVKKATRRLDGELGYGWDNQRGVIRAIEEFFSIRVDETNYFFIAISGKGSSVYHLPWNNGLTVIQKS